jgi:ATP-binding protein involved in chromosome partitioning
MVKVNKIQIIKALEEVIFFPKGNNIVALKMVNDIVIDKNQITIEIVFEDPKAKTAEIVENSSINAIKKHFPDLTQTIKIIRKAKALSYTDGINTIIAVASGKGGVGKSTIAVNLAITLSQLGYRVGILDADIYGPSIPMMFDMMDERPMAEKRNGSEVIIPIIKYGLKVMSIGFFVDPSQALLWRGPIASNALNQLFNTTDWGELDYLILDMPPGTGDIHLTMVQDIPVDGVAIVSTPQEIALADARKAFSMYNTDKIQVPILGLIENMSWFTPAELPQNKYYIFGKEGGKQLANELGLVLLGQIPLVQSICESADQGKPITYTNEPDILTNSFVSLAENIIKRLKLIK